MLQGKFAGYVLKKPIVLKVKQEDAVWCLENEELNICACGKTLEETKRDLEDIFEAMVEEYVHESDENLSSEL